MKKKLPLLFIAFAFFSSLKAQLNESFDEASFPPAGWVNTHSVGGDTDAIWENAGAGTLGGQYSANDPFYVDPHSGDGMATFRSYDFTAGNGAHLISPATDLSGGGPHIISFWMYRDNYFAAQDSVSVYINTTQSATGAFFLGKVIRRRSQAPLENADGWYQYTFTIPASFNSASNYFIFSAVGRFGNNMFIDDISVTTAPSCGVPVLGNITGYNYGAGTASMSWTASAIGSATEYEWAINTTGTAPASGTAINATTLAVTGITANEANYIFIRAHCGGGGYSAWVSKSFAAMPCAVIAAPVNNSLNISQNQLFTWNVMPGATSYQFFLGYTTSTLTNIGTAQDTSIPVTGLLPNTIYYWYVLPGVGSAASLSVCTVNKFTTGPEPDAPVNNACSGAISISAANTAANPVSGTTIGATMSNFAAACSGLTGYSDDDVWFEFTTNASPQGGTLTITPSTVDGITDIVALVYAGADCSHIGSLVTCVDNGFDGSEVLQLSSLSPNTHYYMRVFSWEGAEADRGAFSIVASINNTLPVKLVSFTARRSNGVNILNWSTEQELNTSHFVIERSNDGQHFTSIGKVTAAQNSATLQHYNFTDNRPGKGDNYYRLRTIDKDNISRLSETRRIRNAGVADMNLYPNPAHDNLTVGVNADKAAVGILNIIDINGKTLYSRSVQLQQGNNLLPVELSTVAAGSYIIKLQMGDDIIVQKFNKL